MVQLEYFKISATQESGYLKPKTLKGIWQPSSIQGLNDRYEH